MALPAGFTASIEAITTIINNNVFSLTGLKATAVSFVGKDHTYLLT
jgi:hypothetical protein